MKIVLVDVAQRVQGRAREHVLMVAGKTVAKLAPAFAMVIRDVNVKR